jgi:hypothetical protein
MISDDSLLVAFVQHCVKLEFTSLITCLVYGIFTLDNGVGSWFM